MSPFSRRSLLLGAGVAVLSACSSPKKPSPAPTTLAPPTPIKGVTDEAFSLGVASGDALPDGVILWTRLAADPLHGGGMPNRPIPVDYQVATDEHVRSVARHGRVMARPDLAHSVHADVRGLSAGRDYFYRFRAGTALSPVARTPTAPAPGSSPRRLRLAIANCQDFQNGYWPAFTAMADEDLDFVLHLGDYIYESDPKSKYPDRVHTTPQTPGLGQLQTLSDYRARYGQYKLDPALQAVHAAFPMIATWDDHEVENNYAGLVDEVDQGAARQNRQQFGKQRAAAYQGAHQVAHRDSGRQHSQSAGAVGRFPYRVRQRPANCISTTSTLTGTAIRGWRSRRRGSRRTCGAPRASRPATRRCRRTRHSWCRTVLRAYNDFDDRLAARRAACGG